MGAVRLHLPICNANVLHFRHTNDDCGGQAPCMTQSGHISHVQDGPDKKNHSRRLLESQSLHVQPCSWHLSLSPFNLLLVHLFFFFLLPPILSLPIFALLRHTLKIMNGNGIAPTTTTTTPATDHVIDGTLFADTEATAAAVFHPALMSDPSAAEHVKSTFATKVGLAQMLKGGVIMDVVTPEQAKIAEDAGACAVMALERIPADIRGAGQVARMSDPGMIREIQQSVSIPVMAKARIGHFVEAQILEAISIDYIDESEVLTPADDEHHIDKHPFKVPFVCGCRNLGEALRRIAEGAAFIRTKGEAGTGNVVEAVRHARQVNAEIRRLKLMSHDEVYTFAKTIAAPLSLVLRTKQLGRLPVVQFAAGGVATPADAALMMQLGMDGVFVGSGIFKSDNPKKRAEAIVKAVANYNNPKILASVSEDLGEAMVGIEMDKLVQKWAADSRHKTH